MLDNFATKPLTAEETNNLAVKVQAGDPQAREDLIRGNIPLVRYRVRVWTNLYPHLKYLSDDMVSVGLVKLTETVDEIFDRPDHIEKNPLGFISVAITRAIGRFVSREEVEPKIPLPEGIVNKIEVHDTTEFVDFVDSLLGACESEDHKTILIMKAKGASDEEIANALDCSRQTVQVMRQEIRQNFERNEE